LKQTLEIKRRVLGPEHPDTLNTMLDLGSVYSDEGKYAQAEALLSQTVEIERRVLGPEYPNTLWGMRILGNAYLLEAKYAQAEALLSQTLEIERRALGPENHNTLLTMQLLAVTFSHDGRYNEAQKLFREVIQKSNKQNKPESGAWYNFACGAAIAGHHDEAIQYLGEAVDHGFHDGDGMAGDVDLKSLHGDPRFAALVAESRQTAAKAP
jgi:eukaryotic-like serine/threonine-protein kinase